MAIEFEKQKMNKHIIDLQNDSDRNKSSLEEMISENFKLTEQNTQLVE